MWNARAPPESGSPCQKILRTIKQFAPLACRLSSSSSIVLAITLVLLFRLFLCLCGHDLTVMFLVKNSERHVPLGLESNVSC